MNTKRFKGIAPGVIIAVSLSTAVCAWAGHPKTVVAVYSQRDASFSETITLYSDGNYQQSETQQQSKTQREANTPQRFSLPNLLFPEPTLPAFLREPKRAGVWRVLDKTGGSPVPLTAGMGLPPNAVVALKGAMPFGMTWDNRLPYTLHGDRTLPTGSFPILLPKVQAR